MELPLTVEKNTIGEIARYNTNTIAVFGKYGIDFYCKGKRFLSEACAQASVDQRRVAEELRESLRQQVPAGQDFNSWSLDQLITHIVNSHHQYVNSQVPEIRTQFKSLIAGKQKCDFDISRIADLFNQLANDMKQHMQKEEMSLFPYIQKLEKACNGELEMPAGTSVKSLISVVEFEHDTSGIIIKKLRHLCGNYMPPENAGTELGLLFSLLSAFEADLLMHIHVENNVLHSKAADLESGLIN